jgi:uncharacterized phage protein gp47/JayE
MIDWIVAHTGKISDFNEGSIIRALSSAVALAIEALNFDVMLGWTDAMRVAISKSLGVEKKTGIRATGNVIFSRSTVAPQTYFITTGTIIATGDGVRFITTEDGEITVGNTDSGNISVEAESVGVDGNVVAGTITELVSTPLGIETVNNAAATAGGVNEETDAEFDVRFAKYLRGLAKTTPSGIEAGAEEVDGVHEAALVETDILGVLRLYINDGSGSASEALIDDVELKIEGDGTPENPGYRPAGVLIGYFPSTKITINVTATIYYDKNEDPDTLKPLVETALSGYLNGLKIGEDAILKRMSSVMMGVSGVLDVSISVPAGTRVVIDRSNGEIAKYGVGTLTMEQYEDLPA